MSELEETAAQMRADRMTRIAGERWLAIAPPRFHAADLLDMSHTRMGQLRAWTDAPAGRNLILTGPVGTGKTFAALAAVRPLIVEHVDVAFYPTVELLDRLRPGSGDDHALERCMVCDYLVLDDLGVERPTEWVAERLYSIINRRWLSQLSTVVTTNAANSDELAEHVGERMRSRLVGSDAVVLRFTGPDQRRATNG